MKPPFHTFLVWLRVLVKALILFICFDAIFMIFQPFDVVRGTTIYGKLVTYRVRIMYADPGNSINNQLVPLDTMLAAHEIASPKTANEYRTVILGSSGINGYGNPDDQTVTGFMNRLSLSVNSKHLRAYNLAYPYTYLFKDLAIADSSLAYSPDLLVLFVSYDSMNDDVDPTNNIAAPIYFLKINRQHILQLEQKLKASPMLAQKYVSAPQWWERSILYERRDILDWLRFQLNFVKSVPPSVEEPTSGQLDSSSNGLDGPHLPLAFNPNWTALENLTSLTNLPILVINEPVYIEPRAAHQADQNLNYRFSKAQYDDYRTRLHTVCIEKNLWCLDLWNLVPAKYYTDSAWHRTSVGNQIIAEVVLKEIQEHVRLELSNSTAKVAF